LFFRNYFKLLQVPAIRDPCRFPHSFKRCFYNSLPFSGLQSSFFPLRSAATTHQKNARRGPSPLTPFNNLCPNMHR
jgi:hypothetical protein